MNQRNAVSLLVVALLVAGCSEPLGANRGSEISGGAGVPSDTPAASAAGGEGNTFDHPAAIGGSATTAREALQRMQLEGPPVYTARVHTCRKIRFATIGNILASRGVDLAATGEIDAGRMYRTADQALGAPNYGARVSETTELTTASASRLFDIFVQAAPEIIDALPAREECMGAALFDGAGNCTDDGISCLLGVPATPAHLALCNDTIAAAATPEEGQRIAVASLLAAAYTCE